MTRPAQHVLPPWRGFNLLEMFGADSGGDWREDDFRWIVDWGFDFVRLPCCYRLWVEGDDALNLREPALAKLDRAVDLGGRHGLHVCLNLHRAPGYCVNRQLAEPWNLWKDAEALEAFCFHWTTLARRYSTVPSSRLSFNLVNEPAACDERTMSRGDHERVMRAAVAAVRRIDAGRLVILDGVTWGNEPCPELADLPNVAQSCRGYLPLQVSHCGAAWVNGQDWPAPTWPGKMVDGRYWDRAALEAHYRPWVELARRGFGVHCGECGAFHRTPHDVVLAWLRDVLEVLAAGGIGFALWNFRGPFGVLDSHRADVAYEDFHGHKLDRKLLELLRESALRCARI